LFAKDLWKPTWLTGELVPGDVVDPEGTLYESNRKWYLLCTPKDILSFHWPVDSVVCVCLEALRELKPVRSWRMSLEPLFFVPREKVGHVETDNLREVLNPRDRFLLRDCAAKLRNTENLIYR